jgi:hypothetical protein
MVAVMNRPVVSVVLFSRQIATRGDLHAEARV